MKELRITLLQTSLSWEDAEENRNHFDKLLRKIRKGSTDIILLPEMFSTGFTMNAKPMAETMSGVTVSWMKEKAIALHAVICGSVIIKAGGKYFNRLIWAQPNGKLLYYDKRHLFRMAVENKTYAPGKKKLVVNYKGWKICPLVCYDLRFPVWSRNDGSTDLYIYVANWPERRVYAWKQLLIARAIENQSFVAGLNRVGVDGKNIPYSGDSVVLDPLGTPLATGGNKQKIFTTVIRKSDLNSLRKAFPVAMDSDKFKLVISH